jgi:ZIP family zinc transporter
MVKFESGANTSLNAMADETVLTVIGFLFPWFMTTLGASIVLFFRKKMPDQFRTVILGFAAGVMASCSFFALLLESLEEAESQELSYPHWIPAFIGFLLGCLFIFVLDLVIPHFVDMEGDDLEVAEQEPEENAVVEQVDDIDRMEAMAKIRRERGWKLFVSTTVHNIPEGIAVGLLYGGAYNETEERSKAFRSAFGLALGIGIQNFPEGAAVSLPVKEMGNSPCRGFIFGMLSGVVEPIFGALCLVLARALEALDPWAMAFSAGAMIYVVVEELIPQSQVTGHTLLSIWSFNIGFLFMMAVEYGIPDI